MHPIESIYLWKDKLTNHKDPSVYLQNNKWISRFSSVRCITCARLVGCNEKLQWLQSPANAVNLNFSLELDFGAGKIYHFILQHSSHLNGI